MTLLTDFGTVDGFVGAMKGVVLARAPRATIVDLTHDIPPQDVSAGAWALANAQATFPAGTIHVAVVDPGVGGERAAIIWRRGGQLFVAPDNGLASWAAGGDDDAAWLLDDPALFRDEVSATFHGRDIFACVGAHLAAGRPPERCGSPLSRAPRALPPRRRPLLAGASVQRGQVIHIDRFGNLISDLLLDPADATRLWRCSVGGRDVGRLARTFSDVEVGCWLAYRGSSGTVEVAIRDRSAADEGGHRRGDDVTLWSEDE